MCCGQPEESKPELAFAIPRVVALPMDGAKIVECVAPEIGFGERRSQIVGERLDRDNVVNLRFVVERAARIVAQGADAVLLLNQLSAMLLYREGPKHVKPEPLW
jgi:hypothetical protein